MDADNKIKELEDDEESNVAPYPRSSTTTLSDQPHTDYSPKKRWIAIVDSISTHHKPNSSVNSANYTSGDVAPTSVTTKSNLERKLAASRYHKEALNTRVSLEYLQLSPHQIALFSTSSMNQAILSASRRHIKDSVDSQPTRLEQTVKSTIRVHESSECKH